MIAAELFAQKANKFVVNAKPWVKTSLAYGGSQVILTEYLNESGLISWDLDKSGFNLVGYGCTTCIGNSSPLDFEIDKVIKDNELAVASLISENRNFEGRVHPYVRANYLASPLFVVTYAIAGTANIDLDKNPIAKTESGDDVFLKDILPTREEIKLDSMLKLALLQKCLQKKYKDVFKL